MIFCRFDLLVVEGMYLRQKPKKCCSGMRTDFETSSPLHKLISVPIRSFEELFNDWRGKSIDIRSKNYPT